MNAPTTTATKRYQKFYKKGYNRCYKSHQCDIAVALDNPAAADRYYAESRQLQAQVRNR